VARSVAQARGTLVDPVPAPDRASFALMIDVSSRRVRLAAALVVGVIAFVAAWSAVLPGLGFWDTAELQAVGPLMGTGHPTGFPTWVLLGWLASVVLQPFGEPAFRMNLLSAICLAVAAGITVDLTRRLSGWLVVGIAAGIGLALTPIAWSVATHAETHSLHLVFVAVLLWLLVAWDDDGNPDRDDRFLIAAAVVFGLAVGNHFLTLLLALPIGLYLVRVDPGIWRDRRLMSTCVVALAIALVVVYLELPLRAGPFRAALVYGQPETLGGFLYIIFAQQFQGSLLNPFIDPGGTLGVFIQRAVDQFGILAPAIPIALVVTAIRQPRYALLTGLAAGITCFFAASYDNADILRYYLGPALMAWTWLAILAGVLIEAATDLLGRPLDERTAWTQAIATIAAVALVLSTVVAAPGVFPTVDASRDRAAERWADHALSVMAPEAIIVSWWSYSTPLWYRQRVLGQRPDIDIIDDRTRLDEDLGSIADVIDADLGHRPVYVIRDDPWESAYLAARYDLEYIDGADASKLTRVLGLRSRT
jgi:Protein O-mannosyl-transferase TMEM260-like